MRVNSQKKMAAVFFSAVRKSSSLLLMFSMMDRAPTVYVLKVDKKSGKVLKSKLYFASQDECAGGLVGMADADDFTLALTHISPSAGCILVLNDKLERSMTLYGFAPHLLGHDQVLFTGNMNHFAPFHSEHLHITDLRRGTTTELYPPMDDDLRSKLARENADHMPSDKACMELNDPCEPEFFDEDILGVATGSGSWFAMVVHHSASHVIAVNQPRVLIASQYVLYIYEPIGDGWMYCETEIGETEAKNLTRTGLRSWQFGDTEGRCTPLRPVETKPSLPRVSTSEPIAMLNGYCSGRSVHSALSAIDCTW